MRTCRRSRRAPQRGHRPRPARPRNPRRGEAGHLLSAWLSSGRPGHSSGWRCGDARCLRAPTRPAATGHPDRTPQRLRDPIAPTSARLRATTLPSRRGRRRCRRSRRRSHAPHMPRATRGSQPTGVLHPRASPRRVRCARWAGGPVMQVQTRRSGVPGRGPSPAGRGRPAAAPSPRRRGSGRGARGWRCRRWWSRARDG